MASHKTYPQDYYEATILLGRYRTKPIGNNRSLANNLTNNTISLYLHCTPVVTYHPNGDLTITTGGWYTSTTTATIADVLRPYGWSVRRIGQTLQVGPHLIGGHQKLTLSASELAKPGVAKPGTAKPKPSPEPTPEPKPPTAAEVLDKLREAMRGTHGLPS